MSPIVAPGQVTYPGGSGRALVPADELRAMVWFVGGLSPFGSSGAQRLIDSVDEVGARYAASAARHHPLRWLLLVPLADAVTLPVCPLPPDVRVVPALHGDLLGSPGSRRWCADSWPTGGSRSRMGIRPPPRSSPRRRRPGGCR